LEYILEDDDIETDRCRVAFLKLKGIVFAMKTISKELKFGDMGDVNDWFFPEM